VGLVGKLRQLVAALVLAALGVVLASVLVIGRLFETFSAETLVATVTTRRLSPTEFELTYAPAPTPKVLVWGPARRPQEPVRARLRGDQWMVSGGVVKWHAWLMALGVTSYHKPLRLSGQFSNVESQRAHLPTVHALEPSVDRLWEWFYRADPYLPFVDAVYGSSAYVYVEPNTVQEIYVTHSGYVIKRSTKKR
jgi:hypothetical protein